MKTNRSKGVILAAAALAASASSGGAVRETPTMAVPHRSRMQRDDDGPLLPIGGSRPSWPSQAKLRRLDRRRGAQRGRYARQGGWR